MPTRRSWGRWIAAAALAAGAAGCASVPPQTAAERRSLTEAVIADWPEGSRLTAARLLDSYGLPSRIDLDRLVWYGRGDWKRTVLWEKAPYIYGGTAAGELEQTVAYSAPEDKAAALSVLGGRVRASRDGTELSAYSSSEELNFLALNLADEVLRELRDPQDVDSFYERAVRLRDAGKSSAYMQRLLFLPAAARPAR